MGHLHSKAVTGPIAEFSQIFFQGRCCIHLIPNLAVAIIWQHSCGNLEVIFALPQTLPVFIHCPNSTSSLPLPSTGNLLYKNFKNGYFELFAEVVRVASKFCLKKPPAKPIGGKTLGHPWQRWSGTDWKCPSKFITTRS